MIARFLSSLVLFASVVCENGVCRLVPDGGPEEATVAAVASAEASPAGVRPDRLAQGYMNEEDFLRFLSGEQVATPRERSFLLILLLAVLGGLALNLTPCVLPMIPVNLLVIGTSPLRGLLYGLGQMTAFGVLGLLAALGGVAFGTIQSSPWFNGSVALLLVLFALSLFGAFRIDFSRFRKGLTGGAFAAGAFAAVLAGACVAPILASVLLLTARLYSEGRSVGLVLPFAVGFGLALPWPFLGAGLRVLPRPGVWMRWVNPVFAVFLVSLAVHYALLAGRGFLPHGRVGAADLSPEEFRTTELVRTHRTRPMVVYCHASWCKNCTAMERLIEGSPRIRAALEDMDFVRLDAEDPNELRRLPGLDAIRGLPAFLLYAPRVDP